MVNTQAKLKGSKDWHDYGNVALYEAAKQHAVKTVLSTSGYVDYEWLVYVRRENDNSIPSILVKVKTFVATEIIDPRRGSD